MKVLHRPDLFAWSCFNEDRNIDFNSYLWVRPSGNVAIDPLPVSPHDQRHIASLGGVHVIVVTNSDHTRAALEMARAFGATIAGPSAEREALRGCCNRWLEAGDEVVPGLRVLVLEGSKTPGELALVLEETTLITGDLVRAHAGGELHMLPGAKLRDPSRALESLRSLLRETQVDAVLVGNGWPVFHGGHARLAELVARSTTASAARVDAH